MSTSTERTGQAPRKDGTVCAGCGWPIHRSQTEWTYAGKSYHDGCKPTLDAPSEAEERKAFEEWAIRVYYADFSDAFGPTRSGDGYIDDDVNDAWTGWLARARKG